MLTYRILLDHVDILEKMIEEYHKLATATIQSFDYKTLAELEIILREVQSLSVLQPYNEKEMSVFGS